MLFRKIQGIPYTARRTQDIVQDPLQPKVLYAGTTQGLWKSQDGGDTWVRITSDALNVNAVLLNPRHPNQILLGTEHAGVLLSRNGGTQFASANAGFSSRHVASLVEDPGRHRIYVSVTGDNAWGGVFVSVDRGQSWRQINQGLPGDVYRLLHTPTALLAATERGIDRFDPTTSIWSRIPTSPAGRVYDLTAADRGATLYAGAADGVYISQDGGLQWRRLLLAPAPAFAVAASGRDVLAATNGAVLSSYDGGAHFSGPALYIAGRVNQLAYRGNLWLAATSRGLYFSRGRVLRWTLAGHGLPEEEIVAIHWQSDGIYVSTSETGRMYRSRDEAQHWQAIPVTPQWDQVAHTLAGAFAAAWETALEGVGTEPEAGRGGFHLGRGIPTMVLNRPLGTAIAERLSPVNY
jgi:ligand-binding sensor domain-containing protein